MLKQLGSVMSDASKTEIALNKNENTVQSL
jgi:hypothetical protein